MMLVKLRWFIFILILSACVSKPEPIPDDNKSGKDTTQQAVQKAEKELGVTETEKDLANVPSQTTGVITDMETIADPTTTEISTYRTGEPGWIEVSSIQVFPWSVNRKKAEEIVLQDLRNEAVSKKISTTVEVTSLLTDVMGESGGEASEQTAWFGFFKSTVSGVITDQNELLNELKDMGADMGFELEIAYRFYVEPVKGQRDPGFYVDVELENNMLKEGEELVFSIKPSKDCYLYVFNLMADHNIMLMFPNDYMTENNIKAGEVVQIPDNAIKNHIKFVVRTMPGETLTSESVYIVCTKEPVQIVHDLPKIGTSINVFAGESRSFIELQRWLTNIPLDQRVEKNLPYHVSK